MKRKLTKKRKIPVKSHRDMTLIERRVEVRAGVLKGIEMGMGYEAIAHSCGVSQVALGNWFKKCREIEVKYQELGLSREEIAELGGLNGDLIRRREEYEEKYGEGVITLVLEDEFWLKLIYDLKMAGGRAESKMLGVIREAAIGNRSVTETKTESVMLKGKNSQGAFVPATKTTTTTKELRPQWQAAAWFLERKYPEKYAQRRIVEGELPKDIPYEVFMTAKRLLQLPKVELDKIITALRDKMQPQITGGGGEVVDVPVDKPRRRRA